MDHTRNIKKTHTHKKKTHTPYLTLTGELWDVYCEYFGENWYIMTAHL